MTITKPKGPPPSDCEAPRCFPVQKEGSQAGKPPCTRNEGQHPAVDPSAAVANARRFFIGSRRWRGGRRKANGRADCGTAEAELFARALVARGARRRCLQAAGRQRCQSLVLGIQAGPGLRARGSGGSTGRARGSGISLKPLLHFKLLGAGEQRPKQPERHEVERVVCQLSGSFGQKTGLSRSKSFTPASVDGLLHTLQSKRSIRQEVPRLGSQAHNPAEVVEGRFIVQSAAHSRHHVLQIPAGIRRQRRTNIGLQMPGGIPPVSFPIFPHLGRHLFGRGAAPLQRSFQVSPAQELGQLLDEGGPLRQINVSIWLHLASLRGQHGCVRC